MRGRERGEEGGVRRTDREMQRGRRRREGDGGCGVRAEGEERKKKGPPVRGGGEGGGGECSSRVGGGH